MKGGRWETWRAAVRRRKGGWMCGDLVSNHGTTGRASIERGRGPAILSSCPILSSCLSTSRLSLSLSLSLSPYTCRAMLVQADPTHSSFRRRLSPRGLCLLALYLSLCLSLSVSICLFYSFYSCTPSSVHPAAAEELCVSTADSFPSSYPHRRLPPSS